MEIHDLRVGDVAQDLRVLVIEVWEGGAYLVGDGSASVKMVVPNGFRPFRQFETIAADVEVQKSSLRLVKEKKDAASTPIYAIESCGVIVFARDTKRVLAIRDYHTKPFIDVQFKLKAAFDQRILALPVNDMTLHITDWSNEEVSWIVEWKLSSIWPYATPERIKTWTPVMRKLDNEIKTLYRTCKAELNRRQQAQEEITNKSWGFPKGGCKFVRSRVETPEEVAIRELKEETGLVASQEVFVRHFDVPRPHRHTFDRFFVFELPEEKLIEKPDSAWDVACIRWLSLSDIPESLERFRPSLASLISETAGGTPSSQGVTPAARTDSTPTVNDTEFD